MENTREIMTPEQVAEYLQLGRETIYRYIRNGKLVASRFGRDYRVEKKAIDDLMRKSRTVSQPEGRLFTDEEIADFLENDKIDDEAREVLEKFATRFR